MSPFPDSFDVVVVGGGPAGAAAARHLAGLGRSVLVLTRPRRVRLGKSLPPSSRRILGALGLLSQVEEAGFLETTGDTVWWGARAADRQGFADGAGWQVDPWACADEMGSGLENLSFGFLEKVWDQPGTYRGLIRVTDAVQGADFLGVAWASLDDPTFEETAMGPWVHRPRVTERLDRRNACGVKDEVGDFQFWTFDLDEGRVESSVRFRARSRMLHEVATSARVR